MADLYSKFGNMEIISQKLQKGHFLEPLKYANYTKDRKEKHTALHAILLTGVKGMYRTSGQFNFLIT